MNFLSFGAGVQTVALTVMALNERLPRPDHLIFADTGWESQATYHYLAWFIPWVRTQGFPVHIVTNGNLYTTIIRQEAFVALPLYIKNQNGKQALLRRQCTMQYKIRPITRKIRELVGLKRYQHGCKTPIDLWIGLSYDEVSRMHTNRVTWIHNTYPLIDHKLTRQDCLDYLTAHQIAHPPKSACLGCPYRSDAFFASIRRTSPRQWEDICRVDELIRDRPHIQGSKAYLHRSCHPMATAPLEDRGEQFVNECEGYCGI